MSRRSEQQKAIRAYKDATGEREVDMHKAAKWAVEKLGWALPRPTDPYDLLAKQFSEAAREEIRHDNKTGRPYRANHAILKQIAKGQTYCWIDIDEATRDQMIKSLNMRREQMVNDGLLITYDADHWSSAHPTEEPIQIEMDFTLDIEWRKNAPDDLAA